MFQNWKEEASEAELRCNIPTTIGGASQVAQFHLQMQEVQLQSLSREVPLQEEMAAHSSILAWKVLWTEEPGGPQSMGSQRVGYDWAYTHNSTRGKGRMDHYFLTVNPWYHLVPLYLVLLWPRTPHSILEAKVYVLIEGINSAALFSMRPPFHIWRDIQDQSHHLFYPLHLRIIHVPYGELAPAEVGREFHSIMLPSALWRFNCDTNEAYLN